MRVAEINKEKEINANMLIENIKKLTLSENKNYRIKVPMHDSAIMSRFSLRQVRAILVQQTSFMFIFRITTKFGDKRLVAINKSDYLNNKSLIEVI